MAAFPTPDRPQGIATGYSAPGVDKRGQGIQTGYSSPQAFERPQGIQTGYPVPTLPDRPQGIQAGNLFEAEQSGNELRNRGIGIVDQPDRSKDNSLKTRKHGNPFQNHQEANSAPKYRGKQTGQFVDKAPLVYQGNVRTEQIEREAEQFSQAEDLFRGVTEEQQRSGGKRQAEYKPSDLFGPPQASPQPKQRLRNVDEKRIMALYPGEDQKKYVSAEKMAHGSGMVDNMMSCQYPVPHASQQTSDLPPIHCRPSPRANQSTVPLGSNSNDPTTPVKSGGVRTYYEAATYASMPEKPSMMMKRDGTSPPTQRLLPIGEEPKGMFNPITGQPARLY